MVGVCIAPRDAEKGKLPAVTLEQLKTFLGADAGGHIIAAQAYLAYEAGGYPGSYVGAGVVLTFAPYKIENIRVGDLCFGVLRLRHCDRRANCRGETQDSHCFQGGAA